MSIPTSLGDLTVEPTPMRDLREGDRFVGPDDTTVYVVTTACANDPNEFLHVRRLNNFLTSKDTGTDNPNDAFFSYPRDTKLNRVTGGLR